MEEEETDLDPSDEKMRVLHTTWAYLASTGKVPPLKTTVASYQQHETRFLQADSTDNSNDGDVQDADDAGFCYLAFIDPNFPWEYIPCDPTPFYTEMDDSNHIWENTTVGTNFHNKASLEVFQTSSTARAEVNVFI